MKYKDWLWLIWGLIFPVLGLLYFDIAGLAVGFVVFLIYAWLIRMSTKPKKELEEMGEKATTKVESFTEKMNRITEAVKADTEKRRKKK